MPGQTSPYPGIAPAHCPPRHMRQGKTLRLSLLSLGVLSLGQHLTRRPRLCPPALPRHTQGRTPPNPAPPDSRTGHRGLLPSQECTRQPVVLPTSPPYGLAVVTRLARPTPLCGSLF
ncbi:hypothetical protein AAFF_G00237660 [Aldrovandia affinis]|uniref:Uncharacterized protein n=1 Tax=Aldrovandia affinis TaxID=143900 RepID=A0AAD7REB7_9TELE|nr:hypothetical protein AAFF_G00237660 [Aldrovandia affinis]